MRVIRTLLIVVDDGMNVDTTSIDIKLFPLSDNKQVSFLTDYLRMSINNKDFFKDSLEPIITNNVKSFSSLVHYDVDSNKHFLLILLLDGNNGIHLFSFDMMKDSDDGDYIFTYWKNSYGGVNDDCISCSLCYEHEYEKSNLLMNVFIQNSDTKEYLVKSIRFGASDFHIVATNKHTPILTIFNGVLDGKVIQDVS